MTQGSEKLKHIIHSCFRLKILLRNVFFCQVAHGMVLQRWAERYLSRFFLTVRVKWGNRYWSSILTVNEEQKSWQTYYEGKECHAMRAYNSETWASLPGLRKVFPRNIITKMRCKKFQVLGWLSEKIRCVQAMPKVCYVIRDFRKQNKSKQTKILADLNSPLQF